MRQGPLQVCELLVVGPHELLLAVLHVGLVQLPQAVQLLPQQRLVLPLHQGDDKMMMMMMIMITFMRESMADMSTLPRDFSLFSSASSTVILRAFICYKFS